MSATKDLIHLDDLIQKDMRKTKIAVIETLRNRKTWVAEGMQGLRLLPELLPYVDLIIWVHGGDFKRFRGSYKWWLRMRHAAKDHKVPMFEIYNGHGGGR